jgi:hypothetical protein
LDRWGRFLATALLLVGIGQGGRPALGQGLGDDVSIQVANQFEFYWDTDLDETLVDDRLDASITKGPFTLGATFLSHSPSDPQRLDLNDFGPQVQGVRKRWLEANTSDLNLRIGDVYATFGRGLALQVFEDQTVDYDNVLDGFYGSGSFKDASLEVITGTNSLGDPFQVLKGAQLLLPLPRRFTIGLEGVWSDSVGSALQSRPGGDRLWGGHLGGGLGSLADVYGEYVVRNYENFRRGGADIAQGHGGYANLTLYLGRLQLLTEYKDFLRYELPYINPPTANRSHASTLFNRGSHVANIRFNDERGGLVDAYLTLAERTHVNASYSKSEARHFHAPAWEAYGEIEHWLGGTELVLRGGETEETIREGIDDIFFERITASGTIIQPLSEVWSFEVTAESQGVQESNQGTRQYQFPIEYRDNIVSATLNKSPNMSWALTVEWTDDDRQARDNWLWGEWNIQIADRYQLLLGGGQLRGGQLCSGGICKLVDPFQGGKVEFLVTL